MSKFTLSTNASIRTVGITKAVTTTSDNYDLAGLGVRAGTIRVSNTKAVGLHYALANSAVTATTNDVFLAAGSAEFVPIPANMTTPNIGFICAEGATWLNITIGTEV